MPVFFLLPKMGCKWAETGLVMFSSPASFFVKIWARKGRWNVADLIDRMTRCGIPEKTARCLVKDFALREKLEALTIYVLMTEALHEHA